MTALEIAPARTRSFPWTFLRLALGALLLILGACCLHSAWHDLSGKLVGLGVILLCVGAAACISPKSAEAVFLPLGAVILALILFGVALEPKAFFELLFKGFALLITFHFSDLSSFLDANRVSQAYYLMYKGSFGSWFSFQNTLTRASPLMLTGLCTALPMALGMVMIGGEGCLVVGALISAGVGHYFQIHGASNALIIVAMLVSGFLAGGVWLTIAGALKHYRGVNETISSLLLIYIGIALMNHIVEGPWRDPASLNKPSTWPITTTGDASGDLLMANLKLGRIHLPFTPATVLTRVDLPWGLFIGLGACFICWILMNHTTFGFSARVVGGNVRAAKIAGLSLGKIIIITCMIAGGMAGLAGGIEVAAVQGSCNATVVAGYGYTGILVAFLARQNPLAIIPVTLLLGGISAANSLLQTQLNLPDATVRVLQGAIFIMILVSETYYGRLKIFQRRELAHA